MVEWHVFQNVAAGRRRRARPARQISRRTVCAALGMRRGDLADEINARGNSGAQPAYRAPTSTGYRGGVGVSPQTDLACPGIPNRRKAERPVGG